MRRDFASRHVGLIGSRFQFFGRELRRSWVVAFGQNAAGGKDLDHVHPVLHLGADDVANLVHAIGNLEVSFLGEHADACLRREIVQVAVTAGDGDARTAGNDSGSWNQPFVDRVAQIDGQKRQRAYIAHRRKAGFKGLARIDYSCKGALEGRVFEVVDLIVTIGARAQVRVAINQPGQHRGVGEIDHRRAGRDREGISGGHALNAFVHHLYDNVLPNIVRGAVKQAPGANVGGLRRGRRRRRRLARLLGDGPRDKREDKKEEARYAVHSWFRLLVRG